jgi:hypothetical protein
LGFAQNEGFQIRGLIKSPLLGPKGNTEFLVWLDQVRTKLDRKRLVEGGDEGLSQLVENVLTS